MMMVLGQYSRVRVSEVSEEKMSIIYWILRVEHDSLRRLAYHGFFVVVGLFKVNGFANEL